MVTFYNVPDGRYFAVASINGNESGPSNQVVISNLAQLQTTTLKQTNKPSCKWLWIILILVLLLTMVKRLKRWIDN